MIFASVVFPVPGGPQKIIDVESSFSMASRNGFPGPSRCSCPTNSSSVRGRILSASGACLRPRSAATRTGDVSNKLIDSLCTMLPLCLLLPIAYLLLRSLSARLIQQQTPRHRSIQALHRPRARNSHSRITDRQPSPRQTRTLIPNHHRTSASKIHILGSNHNITLRTYRRNQSHTMGLQLSQLRCRHPHHRHTKQTTHTCPQSLLVPRTHGPRRGQHACCPKRLCRPHQRSQIPRVLQPRRNQNQWRRTPTPHHILQPKHRRHHQRRYPLGRLCLHHTFKPLLGQPQHLHATRHNPRRLTPLTHKHAFQHNPAAQSLFQEMVTLNCDHPSTQPCMTLKRRPQLFHSRIRPARNYVRTHPRILPLTHRPAVYASALHPLE